MFYLTTFLYDIPTWVIALSLHVSIIAGYLLGMRVGKQQKKTNTLFKREGLGPLESALIGLLALLLAFTFSMATSRFDARRTLITQEANYISTALLRADLYPDSLRLELRKDFEQYVETRIAYYQARNNEENINKSLADAKRISHRMWEQVSRFARETPTVLPHGMMIPALNSMIDVVTSRDAARLATVPDLIIWLLMSLTVLGSFIVGYSKKEKGNDWIVLCIYSFMTVITIFTIIDLDRPTRGIIKTDVAHQKIVELRTHFGK